MKLLGHMTWKLLINTTFSQFLKYNTNLTLEIQCPFFHFYTIGHRFGVTGSSAMEALKKYIISVQMFM